LHWFLLYNVVGVFSSFLLSKQRFAAIDQGNEFAAVFFLILALKLIGKLQDGVDIG